MTRIWEQYKQYLSQLVTEADSNLRKTRIKEI
jgi:hypothetical protein